MTADERSQCKLGQTDGYTFASSADSYPYARACYSGCPLLGTDFSISYGVAAVTVTAAPRSSARKVPGHCVRTRTDYDY
jgi:hypothetical protein